MNRQMMIKTIDLVLNQEGSKITTTNRDLLETMKNSLECEIDFDNFFDFFQLMAKERNRQDQKFGVQNHHPFEWLAILGEEVGEVNKAVLETHWQYKGADNDFQNYKDELVQVASVAMAMFECINRNPIKV